MSGKNILRITSAVALLALVFAMFAFPHSKVDAANVSDSKSKQMESDIQKLKDDEAAVKAKLASLKSQEASQYEIKETLEEEIKIKEEEIRKYNDLLYELGISIQNKQAEIDYKSAECDEKFEQFKKRLVVSYEDGQQGYLGMLLSSESISDFFINAEMMNSMLEYDKQVMQNLNDQRKTLTEEKDALLDDQAKQEQYRNDLSVAEKELENKRAEVNNIIYQLQKQEKDAESKIATLQTERKKADDELKAYLAELARKGGTFTQGKLDWPISAQSPLYNYISSPFGNRSYKIYNRWASDFHLGIDIAVRTGTPIYASGDGTVVKAVYYGGSYGTYVTIDHGGGVATHYAHCSSLNVKQGDVVKRGQQIAVSGATGNVTGPHLHFEYRVNGNVVNPLEGGRVSYPNPLVYW